MKARAFFTILALAAAGLILGSQPAIAQSLDLGGIVGDQGGSLTGRIIQFVALLTVLSIAPGLLIMVTSFTRVVIVLSLLRTGLGLQQTPPNMVLISLALFVTAYVMAPTFDQAWNNGLRPLLNEQITEEQAFDRITTPFRHFMIDNVREKDLALFDNLFGLLYEKSDTERPAPPREEATPAEIAEEIDLRVLIAAFMISELRRAFEIGFLIFLPFLVIDIVVATVLMAMGMMMLPPVIISLPFKIVFFVLIDGWYLLTAGLVRSFL
jgi:flagellar biosynthesis protein FliP